VTEERVHRRLAAILAADVVGYSRLMEKDEIGTLSRLKSLRAELIDPKIAEFGGRIVKTMGDGLLVEFPSAVAAVDYGLATQQELAAKESALAEDIRIQFRIGINVGDVIVDDEDIYGDGVNVAARLEALCEPAAIYIANSVYEQVAGKVDAFFDDLGQKEVKNITRPVRVFRARAGKAPVTTAAHSFSSSSQKPSIACLPFKNLSKDTARDYVADGIRLAIQSSLVHMPSLLLIAPPAVNRYRNQGISPHQVAEDLGVRYVLEGAAQTTNGRFRITTQLTDTAKRQVIWAQRYDRDISDSLATQDEIVAKIVTAIGLKLGSGVGSSLWTTLKNLDALDAFYRGINRFYAQTKEDNAAAIGDFEEVFRLQPESPVGPAFLSMANWNDAFMGWADSKNRSLMQAIEWAEKAKNHARTNGFAHIVLACVNLMDRQYDEALDTCYQALKLRPNCPMANIHLANVLHYNGRSAEAVAYINNALKILPTSPPWFLLLLAAAYREIGNVAESIKTAQEVSIRFPDSLDAQLSLCCGYTLAGRREEAKNAVKEVVSLDPEFSVSNYIELRPYKYKDQDTENRFIESLIDAGLQR
jgi:class 3 adenylate cyclase/tetratricopeptide (TPR) repeat protein